jgi:ABC-type phosphate transport system permease subunit
MYLFSLKKLNKWKTLLQMKWWQHIVRLFHGISVFHGLKHVFKHILRKWVKDREKVFQKYTITLNTLRHWIFVLMLVFLFKKNWTLVTSTYIIQCSTNWIKFTGQLNLSSYTMSLFWSLLKSFASIVIDPQSSLPTTITLFCNLVFMLLERTIYFFRTKL